MRFLTHKTFGVSLTKWLWQPPMCIAGQVAVIRGRSALSHLAGTLLGTRKHIHTYQPTQKRVVFFSSCPGGIWTPWNPKQSFINGCLVISNHFLYKGFGSIQLKQPFINGCLGFQVVPWRVSKHHPRVSKAATFPGCVCGPSPPGWQILTNF